MTAVQQFVLQLADNNVTAYQMVTRFGVPQCVAVAAVEQSKRKLIKDIGGLTMLNKLRDEVHQNAVEHGWWEKEREIGSILMLMVTELAETMEEHRNGHQPNEVYTNCKMDDIKKHGGGGCGVCEYCPANKPEGIPIELADTIIRILDYCGKEGIDIEEAIRIKHEYNRNRPWKHGGKVI